MELHLNKAYPLTMTRNDTFKCWPSWALAHLLLRLWVGLRLFMAGVDKFRTNVGPASEFTKEAYDKKMGAIVDMISSNSFLSRWTPTWAFDLYRQYLGWALAIVGALIIIGLFRRFSLFLGGVLLLMLSVGLMALPDDVEAVRLGLQVGLCAFALITVKHDVFSLGFLLYGWWRKRPETDDEDEAEVAA